ncbi:DNA repair protein RecN [Arenimonas sp.]|uniref:DNA repair protein RecN n=1 Tax=Arenimonas sp. TaxID=1872635 RepID=UPI0039E346C8
MLTHLTIKDFAVVSAVELTLDKGLTVVSGETGAGKSLMVDALLWLTGARADAGVVRHGADRAELCAEFGLHDAPEAAAWLSENELDEDGHCQLRRVIRADGGSRAWINGRPATLAQVSTLGAMLVEIHGQHEHQALLERPQQLAILDAFGDHAAELEHVRSLASQWSGIERQLQELSRTGDVGDRVDWLEHQLKELSHESLDPAGIEDLLQAHRRQANASGLLTAYDDALARLAGDEGLPLTKGLRQVSHELGRHVDDEPRLAEALSMLESAGIQLNEVVHAIERLRDGIDLDPGAFQSLEQRLARLHDLSRKHRVALPELDARRGSLQTELEQLRGADERCSGLRTEREQVAAHWREAAARLRERRIVAAERLGGAVTNLMGELGMPGGRFAVALVANDLPSPHALGGERCEFQVSANAGQPPRPLRKVASGGELARISLAIEVAALGMDSVPTMIFDEVDSGIGGAVAETVGRKLRTLGGNRQVLCVTHLPQVAAQGHRHLRVSKSVKGETTHSAVQVLDDQGRIEELARMLGGRDVGEASRANARQMLVQAQD